MYPLLIIHPRPLELMNEYRLRGQIVFDLSSADPLSVFAMKDYAGEREVVLSDVGRESSFRTKLLKVVEEARCKLICISSVDRFDSIFLSRFMAVKKVAVPLPNSSGSSLSLSTFLGEEKPDVRSLVRLGPQFASLYYHYRYSRMPAKRKIFQ